jgi:hypothetical protein
MHRGASRTNKTRQDEDNCKRSKYFIEPNENKDPRPESPAGKARERGCIASLRGLAQHISAARMGEIIPELEDEDEVKAIIEADAFVRPRRPPARC